VRDCEVHRGDREKDDAAEDRDFARVEAALVEEDCPAAPEQRSGGEG
jgi:hypothetical protein